MSPPIRLRRLRPAAPWAPLQGRIAKTNFPMRDYEQEVDEYEAHLAAM